MKNKCDNYTETSGCLMTFNGECTKERCFTYRLLQQIEHIKHLNDLYNQALKDYDAANSKLERIKENCVKTISLMNEDSSNNPYAGGRCIEAGNVLQIIDEVENDN